jgi:hypothetical protein
MKETIKQQWIQALRSNEYTQAVGNLRTDKGYCCLGVLCDLYAKETGYEWICFHQVLLPPEVMEWAGLSNTDPHYVVADEETGERNITLSRVNDEGSSFEDIAQLIEEKF